MLEQRALDDTASAREPALGVTWSMCEILALSVWFFFARWYLCPHIGNPAVDTVLILANGAWFLYVFYISPKLIHNDPRELRGTGPAQTLFIRTDNFAPAMWRFGAVTLTAVLLIIPAIALLNSDALAQVRLKSYLVKQLLYLGSAWVQASIFYAFFLVRFRGIFASQRAKLVVVVASAFLFAAYHAPNPPLMTLTLFAGLAWSWIYYDFPNMAALIISHSVLGTLLHQVARMNMHCGPNYWSDTSAIQALFPTISSWFLAIQQH